jgi:hypothetical protein
MAGERRGAAEMKIRMTRIADPPPAIVPLKGIDSNSLPLLSHIDPAAHAPAHCYSLLG